MLIHSDACVILKSKLCQVANQLMMDHKTATENKRAPFSALQAPFGLHETWYSLCLELMLPTPRAVPDTD